MSAKGEALQLNGCPSVLGNLQDNMTKISRRIPHVSDSTRSLFLIVPLVWDLICVICGSMKIRWNVKKIISSIRMSISGDHHSDFYDLVSFCKPLSLEQTREYYSLYKQILTVANLGLSSAGKNSKKLCKCIDKSRYLPITLKFTLPLAYKISQLVEKEFDELQIVAESVVGAMAARISSSAVLNCRVEKDAVKCPDY